MKKILEDVPNVVEIRLMGRLHFLVIIGVLLIVYFALRSEVNINSKSNHHAIEMQNEEILGLKKQIGVLQDQQSGFCLQYEADMDKYFRDHPEFKRHPWLCGK